MMPLLTIRVNRREYKVEVEATASLLTVLREHLHITSPKVGCETGDCGACSVMVDGRLRRACLTNGLSVQGAEVTTIEGLGEPGDLHPLQKKFYEHFASQCGFCTPGMIMAAKALLDQNPRPTDREIKEALSGNLCRCTGYVNIVQAVRAAAEQMARSGGGK
jgi:aerobic-type carbon monoxide dehydrogenase small subunit (CoxS/CutS family)